MLLELLILKMQQRCSKMPLLYESFTMIIGAWSVLMTKFYYGQSESSSSLKIKKERSTETKAEELEIK